jgi:nicotinate dehydrogenase subunit B
MSGETLTSRFPRRDLLKAGGAMLVGLSMPVGIRAQEPSGIALVLGPDQPDQGHLDSWIAIHADNTATVFHGYAELGQGASTALLQVAAEELDLDMAQMNSAPLTSGRSPNQGATAASAAIALGARPVRAAAAEARLALLDFAATKLEVPTAMLTVSRGVVRVVGDSTRSVSYGELLGDEPFELPFTGNAPVKSPSDYAVVGTSVPRRDIPAKARGSYTYIQHLRLPGMLHGRIVRPSGQSAYADGARVISIDESSIRDIPGARIVRRGDFIGVVAEEEWHAVRAARELSVTWETSISLPGNAGMYARMRAADTLDRVVLKEGNAAEVFGNAAHVVSHSYRGPYQAHVPFAPNCAIADVRRSSARVWSPTQNIYETREKVAHVIDVPVERVSIEYHESSGTFGRSCFDDATEAAAIMSQSVRAPVRVQFMRADEHGWDNFGPAQLGDIRVAMDADGKLQAYEYCGWQHGWSTVESSEQLALGTPGAEMTGPIAMEVSPLNLGSMYEIPNRLLVNKRVPGIDGYLKASNLRSPLDVLFAFASEQSIDELAHIAGTDAYEFRLRNMTDERWLGVLNAVAQAAQWQPRVAAATLADDRIVTGRGIALGTHTSSYAAAVAEIELDRQTGVITAKHLYGALDAGLAVNPGFLENQITGQLVQAASRMLREEVTFDNARVTSLDWASYPILRFEECPAVTPIVVQRLSEPASGGGEEVLSPAAAAIANALFDATGVRLREYPLTPTRVLAALRAIPE